MGKIHEALQKGSSPTANTEDESAVSPEPPPVQVDIGRDIPSRVINPASFASQGISVEGRITSHSPEAPPFSSWNERLLMAMEQSSNTAENFRKLRTKILYPEKGEAPRTILVTSTVPGEGKGFAVANLGCAIAQGMEKCCLAVDCDLRRPTLASLFGYTDPTGLSQFLKGDLEDWRPIVLPTALEKLSVIASGPSPQNPAELIDTAGMRDLLAELVAEQEDRFILLDSPPLQAAAETAVLAQMVDKVLIVVRWGEAGREQIQNLIEAIGHEKIIGIVFNAFELNALDSVLQKKGYYGYYSYYGGGY